MNETKFLKPRDGLIVRDPRTKSQLPVDGANVPWVGPVGRFWRRRVNVGDCVVVKQKKTAIKIKGEMGDKNNGNKF